MQRFILLLLALFLGTAPVFSAVPKNPEAEAALKKLNWRITVAAYSFRNFTFFETADKIAALGVDSIYGFNFQKIGGGMEGKLDPNAMSDEEIEKVKAKLAETKLEMAALYYGSFPNDEAECRRIFERSKRLGVKYFVSEPDPKQLPMLEKIAEETGIIVGLHGHDKKSSPNTWHPTLVARECSKYTPAIGAFNDTGHWIRSDLDPALGVSILRGRTVGFDLHDTNEKGKDVPLGTGVGKIAQMLEALAAVNANPVLIGLEYTSNPEDPSADVQQSIEFIQNEAVRIAALPAPKAVPVRGPGFYAGSASCSITPDVPVPLSGQFYTRISKGVRAPVTANVAALELVNEKGKSDYAILVSLDTVVLRTFFIQEFKKAFKLHFPELDTEKVILCATHTHSAPDMNQADQFLFEQEGVMRGPEYCKFAISRILPAIEEAWKKRSPSTYSFGLGHAVVAYNRRAIYEDGSAVMYGNTNKPNFRAIEGVEDHDVGCMFFWDAKEKLQAILVNVACPSQENEHLHEIDPDYWGPVRTQLQARYGKDVVILGLCGAAGDQSPHIRYRARAEERMRNLRNLERTEEIARRIVDAVTDTYEVVAPVKETPSTLKNLYTEVNLPERKITKQDYENCLANAKALEAKAAQGDSGAYGQARWNRNIAKRWEKLAENPNPTYPTCIHVLRVGETVFCTNQFELYTDFGIQMQARSPATQTFVVQLADGLIGGGTYLPSARAVKGGGYGAIVQSNMVGPEGGQILVEKTLELVREAFQEEK